MARRALLVGINDYHRINDLSGCINDVTNLRSVLKTYLGFNNQDIRVLVDDRAGKAAIMERLKWLVKGAKAGDFLVFHFSGHGSQIRDRDGDELKDRMDELLCPWDMDWDGTFITDDDLHGIFKGVPAGATLEVILDCCHSGTGLRDVELGRPQELGPVNPQSRPRFLPPPVDIVCRHDGEEDSLKDTRTFLTGRREGTAKNQILWAGCRSDQTSADAEIGGTYNGAFTFYFCKHVRDALGNLSRKDVLQRVRASLRHYGYSQLPQLECDTGVRDGKALTPKAKA
jgi:hypothetical protein